MSNSETPWIIAYQAPLSMGFPRQEYWSGLPFPSPGDLPGPGIEPRSPTLQTDALPSEPPGNLYCTCFQKEFEVAKVIFLPSEHSNHVFSPFFLSFTLWPGLNKQSWLWDSSLPAKKKIFGSWGGSSSKKTTSKDIPWKYWKNSLSLL